MAERIYESAEEVAEAIRTTAEELRLPCIALHVEDRPVASGCESRIGGAPLLRSELDWPRCPKGRAMTFLALIDFAAMPRMDGWPEDGLMQVFVNSNIADALEMDPRDSAALFNDSRDRLRPAINPDFSSPFPMSKAEENGVPLRGEKSTMLPSPDDWEISRLWDLFGFGEDDEALWTWLNADPPSPFRLGGHPRFTQSADCRDEDFEHDVTLMALGSAGPLMWGDMGEASFFIRSADLKARRFDDVIFYWDCH